MLKLPIRWRLTFWYAAALSLILLVFCGLLLPLSYHQLLARLDSQLHEELQEIFLESQIARTPEELNFSLQARFRQHETFDFIVYEPSQAVIFASSNVTREVIDELSSTPSNQSSETYGTFRVMEDRYYRVSSRTADGPNGKLIVRVLTPLDPVIADIQTLLALMAALLPLGLVLALLGGYFLAVRALAPVQHIVGVADSITISQLDRRIEVTNPHDELGHLAGTLNRLIARLEVAVDEIRRFTADASHELRTPLAILRSEAEFALRKSRTAEEYESTLRVVVDEATRLGTLADQLLTLSRQDAGLDAMRFEPVEIDPVILDVVESLTSLGESRGVHLKANCGSHAVVSGNDIRLSQVFFNILENAIKYSASGTMVEVESANVGDQVQVVIRDHGPGIPAEHLSHVFERFYRVDPSRNRAVGGSGLGLSIAKSIVSAHGGVIQIKSEIGEGTEVTISFSRHDARSKPGVDAEQNGNARQVSLPNTPT
ncbi:HAMP domain-containing protein [bacterium]|nr:HAMP domain-containing protein [bacterium]